MRIQKTEKGYRLEHEDLVKLVKGGEAELVKMLPRFLLELNNETLTFKDARLVYEILKQPTPSTQNIINQVADFWDSFNLNQISNATMQSFIVTLKPLSQNSQRRYASQAKSILNYAYELELAAPKKLKIPIAPESKSHYLTKEQREAVIASLPDAERRIVTFMANTGARYCEAILVALRDVDMEQAAVELRHRKGNGQWRTRTVPLNERARAVIEASQPHEDGTVFTTRTGKHWHPKGNNLRDMLNKALKQLAYDESKGESLSGLHLLRHTFGTALGDAGADIKTVADMLGHSRLETTRIYMNSGNIKNRGLVDDL